MAKCLQANALPTANLGAGADTEVVCMCGPEDVFRRKFQPNSASTSESISIQSLAVNRAVEQLIVLEDGAPSPACIAYKIFVTLSLLSLESGSASSCQLPSTCVAKHSFNPSTLMGLLELYKYTRNVL